jgi:hypothetical protein
MIRLWAVLVLGLTVGAAAMAESLDDLFDNINTDTVVSPDNTAPKVNALDRPVFLYFGNVETKGVLASGWTEPEVTTPVSSVYYFLHFQGGLDVQPIPQVRLIGTFSTYLPQGLDSSLVSDIRNGTTQSSTVTTTSTEVDTTQTLSVDELFLDYTLYDSAFFRIGKFAQTWGYGHLFNPGNLVSSTSAGVNFKAFAAAGPFALTGLVIANPDFFEDTSHPRADEFGYAGNLGVTEGIFTGNLSVYKQRAAGTKVDAGVRTSLLGLDLYSEALGYQNHITNKWWPGLLAGAYYQLNTSWPWKLLGEYWVDGSTYGTFNRSIGLGATSDPVIKGLDLRISAKWYHSIDDRSGQLVTAVDIVPFPKLDIALAVPWTYGPKNGIYVVGNTDSEKRYLAALLTIGVKFDFEKAR